jgi:hypothetical protein
VPGADGIRRRNGAPLAIDISTTPAKPANVQAEVQMQQALRAAGIDLRIKNYPASLLFAQDGPLYGGTYDLSLTIDTNAPDPDNEGEWSGAFIPPQRSGDHRDEPRRGAHVRPRGAQGALRARRATHPRTSPGDLSVLAGRVRGVQQRPQALSRGAVSLEQLERLRVELLKPC